MDPLLMSAYVIFIVVVSIAIGIAISHGESRQEPAQAPQQDPPSQPMKLTAADQQWLDDLIASKFGEEGQLL